MFRTLFLCRLRRHARRIFGFLFPKGYDGEFFLCGGAFKPLLKKGLHMQDLDLWVRDREAREKLCRALLDRGAVMLRDHHPYSLKFRLEGQLIEVTYHNVTEGSLADVLNTFDLSLSAIGVRFKNGAVDEAAVSDEFWSGRRKGEVSVLDSYFCFVGVTKAPSLLRTLHRMGQMAAELNLAVHAEHEHCLWEMYWHSYTEQERRVAMDLYFDTTVAHKGQHDAKLVHRATVGYTRTTPVAGHKAPMKLVKQPA